MVLGRRVNRNWGDIGTLRRIEMKFRNEMVYWKWIE